MAFATDERATTTMALVADTLAVIGGVPGKLLADRMACLKGGVVANVVVPTAAYVRFASHYGFSPDFCHASDPESKGVVENLVSGIMGCAGSPDATRRRLSVKREPRRQRPRSRRRGLRTARSTPGVTTGHTSNRTPARRRRSPPCRSLLSGAGRTSGILRGGD